MPQMRNPKLSYLYKLLDYYLYKGAGEFISSKIRNATNARSVVFCHRCCRTFIPGVNCSSRLDGKGFLLQCQKCGCKTTIQTDR